MIRTSDRAPATIEKPFSQSPDQLKALLSDLQKNKFPIDRLESLATAADARKDLISDFQRITGTNGNARQVMEELALYSRESRRGENFIEKSEQPEKKGVLRRSWEGVKNFALKHPFVTATLVLALAAGGVAIGYYYAGQWELLLTTLGFEKIKGTAEAIRELSPVTPKTVPLPGGGVYDVPPPMPALGEFPYTVH